MRSLKPIKSLLAFLEYYQENLKVFEIAPSFTMKEINKEYAAWLRLLKKLEHLMDIDFFKASWVPIAKENLNIFIDLDDKNLSIFHIHYHSIKPYQWYRINLFESVEEIINHIKDTEMLEKLHERYTIREQQKFSERTFGSRTK